MMNIRSLATAALALCAATAHAEIVGEFPWGDPSTMHGADGKIFVAGRNGLQVYENGTSSPAGGKDLDNPIKVAFLDGKLYTHRFEKLWVIDSPNTAPRPINSNFEYVGGFTAFEGKLYVTSVNSSKLFSIDKTGAQVDLKGDYAKVIGMTAMNRKLYILSRDKLHEVDPATGKDRTLDGPEFGQPTAMAALNGKLYVAARETTHHQAPYALWEVDAASGKRRMLPLPAGWPAVHTHNATAMTTMNGRVYAAVPKIGAQTNLIALDLK